MSLLVAIVIAGALGFWVYSDARNLDRRGIRVLNWSPALWGWLVFAFALLFGLTFLMTAPLLVVFARDAFGLVNLGSITGLIVMIHHMCGGLGAWIGAALFDAQGAYDGAFALMFISSALACLFSAALTRK